MSVLDTFFGPAEPGPATAAILESITDAVYIVDRRWRFVYLNPQAEVMLRRSREELLGQGIWDEFPEGVGTVFYDEYRRALAGGSTARFEAYYPPLDTWVEVRAYPSAAGLMCYCHDITARKQAEADHRAAEARYRALLQHDQDVTLIVDTEGRLRYVSPAVERVLGYPAAGLLGAVGLRWVHPDDLPHAERAFRDVVARPGATGTRDLRVRHADGGWRWVEARATNLLDDPDIRGLVVTYRDVSERRAAAAALAASEANLAEAQRLAHLGSWEYDYASGTLAWSDELFRIAGEPPQSFRPTRERFVALIHPEDRDRIEALSATGFASGAATGTDFRIVRPDGAVRRVHQRAESRRAADGRLLKRVGIVHDVTERRALEAQLQHQATHDPLTGLPNRALLFDRLGQALARARREGRPCALLFLDLDHFKDINDTRGHDAGDRLLVAVGERLHRCLGAGDTLARLGGDEFTVLLDAVGGAPEAARVAERLLDALAPPLVLDGRAERVTASVGIALSAAGHDRPEALLRDADVALYRAKDAGRAGYALFDPAMQAALADRLALERDLRAALERDEFILHYQPKVDLATGAIDGLEALVRWRHPARGLVPPGAFIPLAEETGLIVPLGRRVLAEACRQHVAWQARHPDVAAPRPSVNLSPRQFRHPDLPGDLAGVLAETGLDPALLTLEVTETAAMAQPEAGAATLRALKALGVRLALDDFGTGYASLAYLQALPVDTLKIDRAFFREGARNRAIVRAVTDLAHGLGLEVTAEGLETAAQVAWARAAGCDRGQGYYFARPLPPEEVEAVWASGVTFDLPRGAASHEASCVGHP